MAKTALDFIHDLRFEDLPPDVVAHAKRCLLDLIGVAAAGSGTRLSGLIRAHAVAHFAPGRATASLLFDGRRVSPVGAALANGMTIDAFDAHDGHPLTKGHVGCGLLPALLALAEGEGGIDGRKFLTGLALGYELGTRAGIALHRTASDYHASGAWVALACAALGARVMGLDAERTRHAIGIAEYHGPRSQMMRCIDHPTMLKDGSGWGAMAGVSAAYLAADGFTGAPAITLEGAEDADLWSDLGTRWRILEQYFKANPVCRWAQPATEAALQLARDHDLSGGDIERVEIVTFHEGSRLTVRTPRSTEEAQYSLPFPVAAALTRGTVGAAEVGEAGLGDPEILRLSQGMILREDAAYSAKFPAERWAHATVTLKNGRVLTSAPAVARGGAENPLSETEIVLKFRSLVATAMDIDRGALIEAAVAGLDEEADLGELFTACFNPSTSRREEVSAA